MAVEGEKIARRLDAWPETADVQHLPNRFDPVDPSTAGRADIVSFNRGRWIVRGSAKTQFSYLMFFEPRTVAAGEYFFATGRLDEGGLSFGLQANEQWVGLVNVTTPGPFAVVLKPDAGRYNLVLANNVTTTRGYLFQRYGVLALWKILTGGILRNSFEIDRAGWTTSSSIPRVGP